MCPSLLALLRASLGFRQVWRCVSRRRINDLVYPGLYILLVSWDDVGGGWSYSSSRMEPLVGAASAVAAGIAVGLAATKRLLGGLQAAAYLEAIIFA